MIGDRRAAIITVLIIAAASFAGLTERVRAEAPLGSLDFLGEPGAGEWSTTRVLGATVVNDQKETIGDVSDLLVGSNGRVVALGIGVGGFLGIGEKSVAVP